MSKLWALDIRNMHKHYNVHQAIEKMDNNLLKELLKFRINFLKEELTELETAENAEDVVDALVDLCVVAIGTLDCFNVDADEAWCRVLDANMKKVPGVKESRPNPLGLPDLIKPEGWVAPNHGGNHGRLTEIF